MNQVSPSSRTFERVLKIERNGSIDAELISPSLMIAFCQLLLQIVDPDDHQAFQVLLYCNSTSSRHALMNVTR